MSYRKGIVTAVDAATGRARVEFTDRDNVVSWWLHVNAPLASKDGSSVFVMPEIGSQVNCLIDERGEEGTILGATFNDSDTPPIADAGHIHMKLSGGLVLDYDKAAGLLTIAAPAGTKLSCNGSEFLIMPDGVTLNADKFTVNAPTVFTQGFSASGGATTAEIDGSVRVSQKLEAGQEVAAPTLRGNLING